jgi:hypothetical protein
MPSSNSEINTQPYPSILFSDNYQVRTPRGVPCWSNDAGCQHLFEVPFEPWELTWDLFALTFDEKALYLP